MFETILIPTDGSPGTERAVAYALTFADYYDAAVHALSVVEPQSTVDDLIEETELADTARTAVEEDAHNATNEIAARASERGIDVTEEVREGLPHTVITGYADEIDADLIALGTHGRTGIERFLVGSTAERVVNTADVPVLTVRLADDTEPRLNDILVPVDGSTAAENALEYGLDIAERTNASLHAIYVVDETVYEFGDVPKSIVGSLRQGGRETLDDATETADAAGVDIETSLLRGVPYRKISEYVTDNDIDFIAMGAYGRGDRERFLLGGTTDKVVRSVEIPVLTVR